MEKRFGIKDFFFCCLLMVLIVSVWLAMKQFDRQFELIRTLKDSSDDQARALAEIGRQLSQGIKTLGNASASTDSNQEDAFQRVKEARAQKGYSQGDWFVQSVPVHLSKITPLVSMDLYSQWVQGHVQEGLLTRDPVTLDWQPLIAKSWTISPDGLTITLPMRNDVTFSDGKPCTADDVVYSYNLLMNPKIEAPQWRAGYEKVASVTKTDDYTIVFKFSEPYFDELGLVAGLNILPKHFYSQFTPEQFNLRPGLLMGTGPYCMQDPVNWAPGEQLVLVRNDRYWGVPSGFDRIIYREINNEVANLTAFTNGEIDLFYQMVPEQYLALQKRPDVVARTQHFEFTTPANGYNFIAWNEQHNGKPTRFSDKRVRQAMTLLIDRPRICKEVYHGLATPADGPIYPQTKQHMPGLTPWPYDPDKGKKMLEALGYKTVNGQLIGPDGQPFRFKLTYPTGSPTIERIVLFERDQLAQDGITLEPDPLDWSVFDERMKDRDFEAITLGWAGVPEEDLYNIFDSSQMKNQGDNFVSYSNPELDKLIEKARSIVDEKVRMPLWQKCDQILHDDQPYTFMADRKLLAFMDGRIKNVQVLPLDLNDPGEWWVPRNMRKWEK